MIQQLIRRIGAMPLLALPILAALCLTACNDEEGADRAAEAARTITFAAAVAQPKNGNADADVAGTRSTIEGTFAEGDLIGVGIAGEIKAYRYTAEGIFVPDEADNGHYWQGNSQEEQAEIIAYYPYNNGEPQCLQPADQSSTEKLAAADILTARTQIKRGQTGPITFAHQPARIVINLRPGRNMDEESLKTAVLTLPQAKLQKITIDPADGSITPEGAPAKDGITPCELATPAKGYCRTAEALCSSQAYTAGTELLRIVVADKTYPYLLPADITLDANTRYTYNVTVNDADITVTTTDSDIPWENTEALPAGYDLLIANEAQLRDFAEAVNSGGTINGKDAYKASVLQTADITLDGTKPWAPIGINGGNTFQGKYNGNGHTIENMTIKEAVQFGNGSPVAGMFGATGYAVLTGINLQNVTIDISTDYDAALGSVTTGSIIGLAYQSTISLCSAIGKVVVKQGVSSIQAGGIIGICLESTISRCRAEVEVMGTTAGNNADSRVGGIAGYLVSGFILSCEAKGRTITAEAGREVYAGGIAGENNNGVIAFCHAGESSIEIKGGATSKCAGGLIGANYSYLYSCYSRANVTAPNTAKAGTIAGYNTDEDNVQHCYGTGKATPDNPFNLPAVAGNIVYNQSPAPDEIFNLMQGFKGEVVSTPNSAFYPTTTLYNPSSTPAYGIDPIRVKWTSAAWKMGLDPRYPEIDMLYQGIDNNP